MKECLYSCTDEIYKDDGRDNDGKDHKGDWGSHSRADREHQLMEDFICSEIFVFHENEPT